MAYIKDTASGNYEVQIYVRDPQTGKRRRKYKTFEDKSDAKDWIKKVNEEAKDNVVIDSKNKTVKYILRKWLKTHKKEVSKATYDGYKMIVESHLIPHLGHNKLNKVKLEHIHEYFDMKREGSRKDGKEGGLSESTLKKHYIVLNNAMQLAINYEMIRKNYVALMNTPKPEKKEAKAMSKKEVKKLLDTAKEVFPWMYNFIAVDLLTGMRRSEIAALTWNNIDLEKQYISIKQVLNNEKGNGSVLKMKTKNKSSRRIIPISDKVVEILKEHKKAQDERKKILKDKYNDTHDYVFAKEFGGNYYLGTFNTRFNNILKKANLPQEYGIHTLRHTFVSICLKLGVSSEKLMALLGHSSYSTTVDIYGHLSMNIERGASEKLGKDLTI